MADEYTISMSIVVTKGTPAEVVQDEGVSFSNKSFAKMANIADLYYELIEKIEKLK